MNLTDWFPGSVKPVHNGVYQREYIFGKAKVPYYCYWDGKQWFLSGATADEAEACVQSGLVAPNQSLRWRGVLK